MISLIIIVSFISSGLLLSGNRIDLAIRMKLPIQCIFIPREDGYDYNASIGDSVSVSVYDFSFLRNKTDVFSQKSWEYGAVPAVIIDEVIEDTLTDATTFRFTGLLNRLHASDLYWFYEDYSRNTDEDLDDAQRSLDYLFAYFDTDSGRLFCLRSKY